MRFYQQQHKFYCGVDLHARSMHVCIVDQDGQTKVHKNIDATDSGQETAQTSVRPRHRQISEQRLSASVHRRPSPFGLTQSTFYYKVL